MLMGTPRNLGDILRLPALADRAAYLDLRQPDAPRSLTAAQLDELIVAGARGFVRRGIRAGARIGIISANRLEFMAAYLGAMRMGAVAVPINHRLPASTVAHMFRDSAIELALVDAPRAGMVPAGVPVVHFDASGAEGFEAFLDPGELATFEPGENDLAEILYTSGSTGLPKGVPLTHFGQVWAITNYFEPLVGSTPLQSMLVVAPLYHMNGLYFTTVALSNRVTVLSLPRFEAREYLQSVARHRCTMLSGIPTMFALMVREPDLIAKLDLSSVREVSIGSAPLTDALLDQVRRLFPRAEVHNGFGTTEAGPAVFGPHPAGLPTPSLSLGYPINGIEWRLIDGPTADEGVLALRTPALMHGYLNLPQVTAQKMRDGWYVTGDVMRRDAHGFFFFVGRADDMFVCGGENLYPGEIEKMLERHPDVAQAIVVPAPDDIKGQIPVAFVVPRKGARLEPEEVKRYALEHGPAYAHPRWVVLRDQLPVSGTHKIDRTSLVAEAARLSQAAGRSGRSPG
jgi:acyl-CoA synthetase (AMP-forming)/AMP-acid ligase II